VLSFEERDSFFELVNRSLILVATPFIESLHRQLRNKTCGLIDWYSMVFSSMGTMYRQHDHTVYLYGGGPRSSSRPISVINTAATRRYPLFAARAFALLCPSLRCALTHAGARSGTHVRHTDITKVRFAFDLDPPWSMLIRLLCRCSFDCAAALIIIYY
jgi:hypothetical protein